MIVTACLLADLMRAADSPGRRLTEAMRVSGDGRCPVVPARLATIVVRVAVAAAMVGAGFYLEPRVVELVQIPEVLDGAITHIRSYNPGLPETAGYDEQATEELTALGRVETALAHVRTTDATVLMQLRGVVGQIRTGVQPLLGRTDVNVASLVGSLDQLTEAIAAVQDPLDDAARALHTDRSRLARAIDIADSIADQVRDARHSARNSADDVSGPHQ